MNLLLIHGIAQGGKDPKKLEADWLEALSKGLDKSGLTLPAGVKVLFPYYGDVLDDYVRQADLPADGSLVAAKGRPVPDDYAQFRARMAGDLQRGADIEEEEIRVEAGPQVSADKGPQNALWVLATLRVIDHRLPGVGSWTIEKFLKDVFLYTRRQVVRDRIDTMVTDLMDDSPTVVVGHSLGSVVAYNVAASRKPAVTTRFVTVGSPLGLPAVRETLGPLQNPAGPPGWLNAFDRHDVVALYPLDATHFGVRPAIVNRGFLDNWTENHHGIVGYLDDQAVARTIYDALTS